MPGSTTYLVPTLIRSPVITFTPFPANLAVISEKCGQSTEYSSVPALRMVMTASPFTVQNFIPDRVEIIDNEGNRLEKQISVIVNAPPEISKVTTPANGDTLYGNSHTPFLFAWYAWDRDDDDIIYSIIEIDGKSYSLGELDNIRQSGLDEGEHTFRIIVEDSRGDRDSIPSRTFFVLDTLEGK